MRLQIDALDPTHFFSASGLTHGKQTKKPHIKVKLDLLADINMSLTVGKGVVCHRICHTIHWYAKANNKYMKD